MLASCALRRASDDPRTLAWAMAALPSVAKGRPAAGSSRRETPCGRGCRTFSIRGASYQDTIHTYSIVLVIPTVRYYFQYVRLLL